MSSSRTYTTGAVLTAAQVNDLAQGTLGYAQAITNQTGITTEASLTGLTATFSIVTGRRIKITGSLLVQGTVASDLITMRIKEGATILQQADFTPANVTRDYIIERTVVIQPSAGAHTYNLTLARDAGTGTASLIAAATFPSFILVEDIGV